MTDNGTGDPTSRDEASNIAIDVEQRNRGPRPQPNYWAPEPRIFSGKPDEDVDDWLRHYERVSRYHNWSTSAKLMNVAFFLAGTALLWFDNHERILTTWETFVEEFRTCFGDSCSKKKRAEQTLSRRAQLPGETCTTYIEEILKLCGIVNGNMSDEDKVGHLLKGIAEDVYNFLIAKDDLSTPTDFRRLCRAFEALKTRRILPKFGRLENVPTVASMDVTTCEGISSVVRRVVREELVRLQDADYGYQCAFDEYMPEQPLSWARERPIERRQPPEEARFNASFSALPTRDTRYQLTPPRPRPAAEPYQTSRRPQSNYYQASRRASELYSRTPHAAAALNSRRDSPVCYTCGVRGHISRFCHRPHRGPRFSTYTARLNDDATSAVGGPHLRRPSPTRFRDDSPASDRSITPPPTRPRRSPSPRRWSPSPPQLGN